MKAKMSFITAIRDDAGITFYILNNSDEQKNNSGWIVVLS